MTRHTSPIDPRGFSFPVAMERIKPAPQVCELRQALDRAVVGEGAALSDFWRKNTSPCEADELAKVLRALRKVAGSIGDNAGRIEWAGMSEHDQVGTIVLDPALATGDYPVPGYRFDYLVGVVAREALHTTEWTGRVWRNLDAASLGHDGMEKVVFQKFVHHAEQVFVDLAAACSILGLYCQWAKTVSLGRDLPVPGGSGPSVDELFQLWWAGHEVRSGNDSATLLEPYRRPMELLGDLVGELEQVAAADQGPVSRCKKRSELYRACWGELGEAVRPLRVVDRTLVWTASGDSEVLRGRQAKRKSSSLSPHLAQDVEERLSVYSTDLTPVIRSVVGDADVVQPTSRWDFNVRANPVIDQHLVARLKVIFQTYADRKIRVSRGLTSGRIDSRRLYRAPINGKCFLEKHSVPSLNWNICLLVDASGSLRGPRWRMVEDTVGTLHKAFGDFQNKLHAYAYFEVDGVCMISKLIKEGTLLSVPPNGRTASGQALIAAAHLMGGGGTRNFMIHVTDGESNFGCDVSWGLKFCEQQGIGLVTLGCAYKDREGLREQYGRSIQFLDHYGQLPSALERLLKWTFVYGEKGASRPLRAQ